MTTLKSLRIRMNTLRTQLVRASQDALAAGRAVIRNEGLVDKMFARVKVIKKMMQAAAARVHTMLFHRGATKVKATFTVFAARGLA